jgi:hypothetical protein
VLLWWCLFELKLFWFSSRSTCCGTSPHTQSLGLSLGIMQMVLEWETHRNSFPEKKIGAARPSRDAPPVLLVTVLAESCARQS